MARALAAALALTPLIISAQDLQDMGDRGYRLLGSVEGNNAGASVSGVGDVNGDGFADLIVGAPYADENGSNAGASYVVFGRGRTDVAEDVDLANLGDRGFHILGAAADDFSGRSVAGAGDVNGDGLADVIVGAPYADANGVVSGASYVVFGRRGADALEEVNLANLGDRGFRIVGEAAGDFVGFSVSGAGDVNGDGLADLVVGARYADASGVDSGASYVVFGRELVQNVDLGNLGDRGFRIVGAAGNRTGFSVSGTGDLNGDGYADLIVGAPYSYGNGDVVGESYVVFGRDSAEDLENVDLGNLGDRGFRMFGAEAIAAGRSVSGAGDVNGDGFADLILGAPFEYASGHASGVSYVVFGQKDAEDLVDVTLGNLGNRGFRIVGAAAHSYSGGSVSGIGDFNGDGLADLLVGAPLDGRIGDADGAGASYVVFGRAGLAGLEEVKLGNLGDRGFRLAGDASGDFFGLSVSGAGDINGDGLADLIVGAPRSDANGEDAGAAYVLFGTSDVATARYRTHQQTRGCQVRAEDKGNPAGITGDGSNDDTPDARLWLDYCRAPDQDPQLAEPRVTLQRQAPSVVLSDARTSANVAWSVDFGLRPAAQPAAPSAHVTLRYTDADIAGLDESTLWIYADSHTDGDGVFEAGHVSRWWPERNLITIGRSTHESVNLALGALPFPLDLAVEYPGEAPPATIAPGDPLSLHLRYRNDSVNTAQTFATLTWNDVLLDTSVRCQAEVPDQCPVLPPGPVQSLALTLAPNSFVDLVLEGRAADTGTIKVDAQLLPRWADAEADSERDDNQIATTIDIIAPQIDLAASVAAPLTARPGASISAIVHLANTGNVATEGATTVTWPAGLSDVTVHCTDDTLPDHCPAALVATSPLQFPLTLPPGQHITLTITGTIATATDILIEANYFPTPDPSSDDDPINNEAATTIRVLSNDNPVFSDGFED